MGVVGWTGMDLFFLCARRELVECFVDDFSLLSGDFRRWW